MLRARLRLAAAALWVALCVASAASGLTLAPNQPLLAPHPDCATQMDAELAELRPFLPRRGVIGYVGPRMDEGCDPMFVAQYALAPVYVVEVSHLQHRLDLAARRTHYLPRDLPLVLVWGHEGRRWLAEHPNHAPLGPPTRHAQLAARTR